VLQYSKGDEMNLYVMRHGQTDWNKEKKLQGRVDVPLNKTGLQQAEEAREVLGNIPIDVIVCSPMQRTRQTVEILNRGRGIPVIYDERIVERGFGPMEGKTPHDFDFRAFWDYDQNIKLGDAEKIQDLFKRVYDFLDEAKTKYENENVLLITHGAATIPIYCYYKGEIPKGTLLDELGLAKNCEIVEFRAATAENK
jgi:probable phosphoglycerate mutase